VLLQTGDFPCPIPYRSILAEMLIPEVLNIWVESRSRKLFSGRTLQVWVPTSREPKARFSTAAAYPACAFRIERGQRAFSGILGWQRLSESQHDVERVAKRQAAYIKRATVPGQQNF